MKKILTALIAIALIANICAPFAVYAKSGIELPDVNVGGNKENGDDKPAGETPETPDNPDNPDNPENPDNPPLTAFEKLSDVKEGIWYFDKIKYAVDNKLFVGVSETQFMPEKSMTRAEFVQVLSQIDGIDVSDRNVKSDFSDVKAGQWYAPAVKWASDNKIVEGMGNGKFEPNAPISREQMCVMLVNYIAHKGIRLEKAEDKSEFKDDTKISDWAKDRVYACQMANIINGMGGGRFAPQSTAIRAEVATMFTEFHKIYINK